MNFVIIMNWIITKYQNMSTSKSAGATKLGRDSRPKYLGVKLYEGQKVKIGNIIIRQRGTKFLAGKNVSRGGDDTLFSLIDGSVHFTTKRKKGFNDLQRIVKTVHVLPIEKKK